MSQWRRSMATGRRDAAEPAVIEAFVMRGWSAEQISSKGGPDLVVGAHGYFTGLVEVKTPKRYTNKATKTAQSEWHTTWRGHPVAILRTADAVAEYIDRVDEALAKRRS